MLQETFLHSLRLLKNAQLPDGGFPHYPGEKARPDATSWAILSMSAWAFDEESCTRARTNLVSQQMEDGRINISPNHPDASWPTPLAILAWQSSSHFRQAQKSAVHFLLNFSGYHFPKPAGNFMGHDPSIVGWPWIADTHSWVLPTALAIIALQQVGFVTHSRVTQGQRMILNRQLPHGGWNYGNSLVFGKELHPLPECTGIALQALARKVPTREIQPSLHYLLQEISVLKTPISLGWALLGLSAWGLRPAGTENLILRSLQLQERYGAYPLPSLALLLCAMKASRGLHSLFHSALQDDE